jgi:hypothetical protein
VARDCSRLLVYVWLAGAANALAADPALSVNADDRGGASSSDDRADGAAFNPFASVGIAVDPAVEAPAQSGDWALPLVAALVGMVCIGKLVRKLLD